MKIYKVLELTETKGGQTYVSCKVFGNKKDAQKYYLKEKVEIRKWLKDGWEDGVVVEEYTYEYSVVFECEGNYVTLYKVEEDELN